jgi:hypothetical protein
VIRQEWHVDDQDLAAYAAGDTGPVMLSSIEAHLTTCETCRAALTAHVHGEARDPVDDRVWAGIVDRVDRGGRLFTRSSRLLHVSLSSPPLALVTLVLAGLLIAFVGVARLGESRYATTMLVSVGPLVPLIGARLAFGRRIDPAGLMAGAAPMAAGRVASTRALVATTIACLAGIAVSPLTTLGLDDTLVWLLPALALSTVIVAISTYVDATIPMIAFATAWLAAVALWLGDVPRALRGVSVEGLVSDEPAVQAALLVCTVAAIGVCFVRRDASPNWRTVP